MPVKLGVAPICWSHDALPELGGDSSMETCLQDAANAGYAGVEMGGNFPMEPGILKPLLDKYGLRLVSGWFSGQLRDGTVDGEMARLDEHLNTFAALDSDVVVYADVSSSTFANRKAGIDARPIMKEAEFREYGEKLTDLAKRMLAQGVRLAFHHHMGIFVEDEADIDLLMSHTGTEVGLTVDTGHLAFAGCSPSDVLRRHAARIKHVHLKDIRREVLQNAWLNNASFFDAVVDGVFTVPGDGDLDFGVIAKDLYEIGYDGWIVVEAEQNASKANPAEYVTKANLHLRYVLADADIKVGE